MSAASGFWGVFCTRELGHGSQGLKVVFIILLIFFIPQILEQAWCVHNYNMQGNKQPHLDICTLAEWTLALAADKTKCLCCSGLGVRDKSSGGEIKMLVEHIMCSFHIMAKLFSIHGVALGKLPRV